MRGGLRAIRKGGAVFLFSAGYHRAMDRFARYSWFTLACNVAVILWGTIVRATGSGAGCGSHWPLCNGVVLPRAPRIETVIEFSHRLTSGLALLLVVGLVVGAFRLRPKGDATRKAAVFSMIFMLGEAAVGAGLVLFELVADNQSMARALFMATHLVNTFFLLAALTLTAHFASGGAPFKLRGVLGAGFILETAALLLAGVSGAVAALGDTLFPSMSLADALKQDLSPTAHLLVRLRLLHPLVSVAAGVVAFFLALQLLERGFEPSAVRSARRRVMLLVLLQIVAGAVNVLLLAPVWMQVVHLLLADLLWISFVLLGACALACLGSTEDAAAPLAVAEGAGPGGGLAARHRPGS
ncbi:MAG TPA: COX15/CtaA family protein [Thermoanaerobaculia bacterium]|nr:COX15/CtaA family protein [Thermoanaerobaculia bacterium]